MGPIPKKLNRFFIWRVLGGGVRRRRPPFLADNSNSDHVAENAPDLSQPAPEDFLPSPPKPMTPFQKWPEQGQGRPVAIIFLLMVCLSIAEWGVRWPWDSGSVYQADLWTSRDAVFTRGEYWRLLSALFVHADFMHLAHNAMTFLFFGWVLRGYFGRLAFPVLSFGIGIIANLITIWFHENDIHLLGASGMNYGMVALWLTLYIAFDRTSPMPQRVVRSLGFSLLILFPQSYEPRVSYLAHASGFVVGILVGMMSIPLMRRTAPVVRNGEAPAHFIQ